MSDGERAPLSAGCEAVRAASPPSGKLADRVGHMLATYWAGNPNGLWCRMAASSGGISLTDGARLGVEDAGTVGGGDRCWWWWDDDEVVDGGRCCCC